MYKRYVIKSKLGIPIKSGKLMSLQPGSVWRRTFTCCAFVPSPPGVVVVRLGCTVDSGHVLFCAAQVRSAWPSSRPPFLPLLALSGSESGSWTSLPLDHCAEIEKKETSEWNLKKYLEIVSFTQERQFKCWYQSCANKHSSSTYRCFTPMSSKSDAGDARSKTIVQKQKKYYWEFFLFYFVSTSIRRKTMPFQH